MRKAVFFLSLVVAACGGVVRSPDSETAPPPEEATTTTKVAPTTTTIPEPREVWQGFAATQPTSRGLVAYAKGPIEVFGSPDALEAFMTLEPTTILGTTLVLGVVDEPSGEWVEVMLPIRPNGSTGWVSAESLEIYVADSEIFVDLSERTLSYRVGDVVVLETEVGIGSEYNQTPTGHFFVTDSVSLANPNSPWGPHALGISARSDTITGFNGGDGIIGIHGTNNPSSIGSNISLGCVRLPNDMITALHELVPVGTRVIIEA